MANNYEGLTPEERAQIRKEKREEKIRQEEEEKKKDRKSIVFTILFFGAIFVACAIIIHNDEKEAEEQFNRPTMIVEMIEGGQFVEARKTLSLYQTREMEIAEDVSGKKKRAEAINKSKSECKELLEKISLAQINSLLEQGDVELAKEIAIQDGHEEYFSDAVFSKAVSYYSKHGFTFIYRCFSALSPDVHDYYYYKFIEKNNAAIQNILPLITDQQQKSTICKFLRPTTDGDYTEVNRIKKEFGVK